jgi:hypothetical protein
MQSTGQIALFSDPGQPSLCAAHHGKHWPSGWKKKTGYPPEMTGMLDSQYDLTSLAAKKGRLVRPDQSSDPDRGVGLTVAASPPNVFSPPKFLNDDLLGSKLVHHYGSHLGALDLGGSNRRTSRCAGNKQNVGKNYFISDFRVPPVNSKMISFADFELVAAVFNNRIHAAEAPREDLDNADQQRLDAMILRMGVTRLLAWRERK